MKSAKNKVLGICLGSALLASCAGGYDSQDLGTVLGAGSGALIGSSFDDTLGAVVGAGAGALIGREIGRQADDEYRTYGSAGWKEREVGREVEDRYRDDGYRYDDDYGYDYGYRYDRSHYGY